MMIRIHRKARVAMKVRIVRMVSFAMVTRTNGWLELLGMLGRLG